MDSLPEKGVLVGLAIYEYIDPRQGAVKRGNKKPSRAFKNLTKILTLQIQSRRILDSDDEVLHKIMISAF